MKFDFKLIGIRFLIVNIYEWIDKNETFILSEKYEYAKVSDKNCCDIFEWKGKKYVEIFKNFLKKGHLGAFVYNKQNKVVGRAVGIINKNDTSCLLYKKSILGKNSVRIGYFEVNKNSRGLGISKYLLKFLLLQITENSYKKIYIDISSKNLPMQNCVKKCGFEKKYSAFVIQCRSKNLIEIPFE